LAHNQLQDLPAACVAGMVQLREIELGHNSLVCLPGELFLLPNLIRIDARQNQITHIPEIPVGLPGCESRLAELYLGCNRMSVLTPSLGALGQLAVLDVGDNELSELPKEVAMCKMLRLLDLRNNNMSTLPPQLGVLSNLNKIVLEGNPMRAVRRNVIEQGTTAVLDFLRSRLTDEELKEYATVVTTDYEVLIRDSNSRRSLDLKGHNLEWLPAEMVEGQLELFSLVKVILADNRLAELPLYFIGGLTAVRELDASGNNLKDLPPSMQEMSSLTDLNLARNQLSEVPSCLAAMPHLKRLDLAGNQIACPRVALPPLQQLDELHLSSNNMEVLPQGISSLAALSILDVATNKLKSLPTEEIMALSSLQSLDISNNDIKELAPAMGNMTQLRALLLHGNPLRSIRRNIIEKGTVAVLDYLRSRIVKEDTPECAEEIPNSEGDTDAIFEGFDRRIAAIEEEMVQPGLSGPKVYALKKKLAMEKAARKKEERRLAAQNA